MNREGRVEERKKKEAREGERERETRKIMERAEHP